MRTPHWDLTTLDVSLEPDRSLRATRPASAASAGQKGISLVRCAVLTRHLERIVGAIQRAVQLRGISDLQFLVSESELLVNGHPAIILTIDSDAKLRRLRSRVLKAITPGTIVVDSSPSVSDFQSRYIGPIVFPDMGGRSVSHSQLSVQSVAIYKVEEPKGRVRTLLRRINVAAGTHRLDEVGTA